MPQFQPVRGMNDYLPQDAKKMRYVEQKTLDIAQLYGYDEVITPIVESYELLAAKAGEEIRHRMYQFNDMAGRKIALRAEFTPSIARLVATKMQTMPKPLKLFCMGSLYRYDEPQLGRSREFWQANYELMGTTNHESDTEIITLTSHLLDTIGLRNHYLKIGHVGILRGILGQEGVTEAQQNQIMQQLDKKQWNQALTTAQNTKASPQCLQTLKALIKTKGQNPTKTIQKIRKTVQNYETASKATQNLQEITELLKNSGKKSDILIDAGFARGLEYYTGMIFETYIPELERAGLALGGGGRYDTLIELFGGQPTPAVGVALGIDRIVLATDKQNALLSPPDTKRVAVIPLKEETLTQAYRITSTLRQAGIPAEIELMRRTVSKALSDADRKGFHYSVLIGQEEAKKGTVTLRNMKKREQKTTSTEELITEIAQQK
ncbi:MAG TPA: histidine--tRNA ligase [Candidatus Bathyarchaeia archaeon]|nr:histidine--tRNA ligase [Candidatus Bathyarchaeia archaeon]